MSETTTTIWSLAGWTILHYVWVGVLLTGFAWLGRLLLFRASSQTRYLYTLTSFLGLALAPIAVCLSVFHSTPHPVPLVTSAVTGAERMAADPLAPIELLEGDRPLATNVESPTAASPSPLQFTPLEPVVDEPTWRPADLIAHLAGWAPALWLIGFPIALCWLSAGLMGADRLRKRSKVLSHGPIFTAVSRLATTVGLARAPRLGVCEQIARPILIGILRPMILLPPAAVTGWTPEQIEVVLLHELTHIRRADNLVCLLQRVVEAILFFQPGIWIVSGWIRLEREQCCDDAVVQRTRDPQFYVETLVFVARLAMPPALTRIDWQSSSASAMAQNHLVARIRRILHKEQNMKRSMSEMRVSHRWGLSLVLLLGALLVLAGTWGGLLGDNENTARADHAEADDEPPPLLPLESTDVAEGYDVIDQIASVFQPLDLAAQRPSGPPKERLRYDGKTFAVWEEEWQTELNPTRRVEAIEAFEAFARNGYGEEAAVAILNVMRRYDTHFFDKKSAEGRLKSKAMAALVNIDRKHWVARIATALKSPNPNEVHFAMHVIRGREDLIKSNMPALLDRMRDKDIQLVTHAIEVAQGLQPRPPELQKRFRQLLLSKQTEVIRLAAEALVPHAGYGMMGMGMGAGMGMEMGGMSMAGGDEGSGGPAGMGLPGLGGGYPGGFGPSAGGLGIPGMGGSMDEGESSGPAPAYIPELVEALKTATSQSLPPLQDALARLGPNATQAVPALIKLLDQPETARSNALTALATLGPRSTKALPLLVQLADDSNAQIRARAVNAIARILAGNENSAESLATVKALKQRYEDHSELRVPILRAWYHAGTHAVAVRDVLNKATYDTNPHIFQAANAILSRLPKER